MANLKYHSLKTHVDRIPAFKDTVAVEEVDKINMVAVIDGFKDDLERVSERATILRLQPVNHDTAVTVAKL